MSRRIPGPTFFHTEEDASVGRYFPQSLINKEPKLKELLFIGLDRKKKRLCTLSKEESKVWMLQKDEYTYTEHRLISIKRVSSLLAET